MGTHTTMTGQAWCDRYGVTFDWSSHGFHRDDRQGGWEYQLFRFTLTASDGKSLTLDYRAGLALYEDDEDGPTANDTLPLYARDVRAGEQTWEEYAGDFHAGDPEDAPLALYRTWEACREARRKLYDFMASEAMWEDFLSIREDDEDDD